MGMIILRVFPLSFSILWRFLIALPVWVILYIIMTVLSVYGFVALAGVIPAVGWLVGMVLGLAVSFIITMHPYLLGIHIGLSVLGVRPKTSQTELFGPAIGYGIVEAAVGFVLSGAVLAVWLMAVQGNLDTNAALNAERAKDPVMELSRSLAFGTITIVALISNAVLIALRAALLPVLAGAAAGRSPRGGSHAPFQGFGNSFLSIMAVLLMSIGFCTFVIPYLAGAADYVGLISSLTNGLTEAVLFFSSEQEFSFTVGHAIMVVVVIVLSVWLFCLECAAAALAYQARMRVHPTKAVLAATKNAPSEDISALLKARMPKMRD